MNFPLENLTSKENINYFSTPKFRDIKLDNEGSKKNNIFKYDQISKNSPIYGAKNQPLKNIDKSIKDIDSQNPIKENKTEIYLKENFSLSSLNNNSSSNDKIDSNKNIIDIKINTNKKRDKEDKCNVALISFCDKSDNYSFNNYSCSTNKDNHEININNNNQKSQKEKNNKESEMKSNNSNNSNSNRYGNNNTSFKYNLPLEKDKTPFINDFIAFQYSNNLEIQKDKSLELENNNRFENKNKSFKIIKFNKKNLLDQYNINNLNNDINLLEKKVKKSKTEKFCRINKLFPFEKNYNKEIKYKNNSVLYENFKNKKRYLVTKKTKLHSYDNYKKSKKKIKISAINEIQNKAKENEKEKENQEKIISEKNNKIVSPRKKFELIIKQIDLNIDNNEESNEESINKFFSSTSREPKSRNNILIESKLNSDRKSGINYYLKNNYNRMNNTINYCNRASNTTNRLKYKNRKLIKSTPLENNYYFNYNKFNKFEETKRKNTDRINKSKELNSINKKLNSSHKYNPSKNFKKKDLKIVNNQLYHTRNISNLYSNKMFNDIKNLFNNNLIFNTINYETNNTYKKVNKKNIIQTKLTIKPHIKTIINKASFLTKTKDFKIKNAKNEIPHLYINNNKYINSNNKNNYINNRYHTIIPEQNTFQKNKKKKSLTKNRISKVKKFLLKNKNNYKTSLKFDNKNQSTCKLLTTNSISGNNTDRNINNTNVYNSVKLDSKLLINDSIFINVNDSTNSLQNNSNNNKIKVNTIKMHKKIPPLSELSSNLNNKNKSYWKIHKKPKNSCLLNGKISRNGNHNLNSKYQLTLGGSYEKYIKGNSQILIFNKNQPNKFPDLNELKKKIHQYNLTNNNSKSIISESSYTEKNNYSNSINENMNIEKEKAKLQNIKKEGKIKSYKIKQFNFYKSHNKNKSDAFKNKSNDFLSSKIQIGNYKSKMNNFKEEMLKYSILRNNQNNQIINEFSVVLGEEKHKNVSKNNEKKNLENKNDDNNNKSMENKKTIINVNQFYPSYYIGTHEIIKFNKKI